MKKSIIFYISGHGHGHAVRQSFLINQISSSYSVWIVSSISRSFFNEEIHREFQYREKSFDCGVIQRDALTADVDATIEKYFHLSKENDAILESEVSWLVSQNSAIIVSDIVPFASVLAKGAKIPSILISNFTWLQIYESFSDVSHPKFLEVLSILKQEYESFTETVQLYPGTIDERSTTSERAVLLRSGTNHKSALKKQLQLSEECALVLIYIGVYGVDTVDWEQFTGFENVHFISFYSLPIPNSHFTQVSKGEYTLQDYAASVDCIITKPGYGTVSESLSSGTPMLFIPRDNFIEYESLKKDLLSWGSCFEISAHEFKSATFEYKLQRLICGGKRENRLLDSSSKILQKIYDKL